MNDLESQKGNFLMRRIEYTPDFANIYCDIRIKWLQDIYFNSIINMPYILLGRKIFQKTYIFDKHISVDLEEWTNFASSIISAFRTDNIIRKKIIKSINEVLKEAEDITNRIYKKVYLENYLPTLEEVKILFEFFGKMDSFAIFNMFIPSNYYYEILDELGISNEFSIDDIMLCSFIPHRLQVRLNKLILTKKLIIKDKDFDQSLKRYMIEYAVYEQFENIAFNNEFLKNDIYLKRELHKMSKEYSIEDIDSECTSIKENRMKQKNRMTKLFNMIDENVNINNRKEIVEIFSFLILIVSEEERRHMIECKIMAIFAEVFAKEKIDISRCSIKDILSTYKFLKGDQ